MKKILMHIKIIHDKINSISLDFNPRNKKIIDQWDDFVNLTERMFSHLMLEEKK